VIYGAAVRVELLQPSTWPVVEPDLAAILVDCVAGGASVGFLSSLTVEQARRWWHDALRQPGTLTWAAWLHDGPALGVVQFRPAAFPNAAHRAEVVKLLVHRGARGRGLAGQLMDHLEAEARRQGRWLLLLDTQTGSTAERLYARWGWQAVGIVDEHAADPAGRRQPTTFMAKRL